MDWINWAHDSNKWRDIVNGLQVPQTIEELLKQDSA